MQSHPNTLPTAVTESMLLQNIANMNFNFDLHMNGFQSIDEIVDREVQRIQTKCLSEEQQYVEQMLQQHPVVVDRRAQTQRVSSSDETSSRDSVAQQRAESCRRSRINNKVKQAKTKFRHKFISHKLALSASNLDCLREMIAQTEAQLLLSGCDQSTLQNLRNAFGVDKE